MIKDSEQILIAQSISKSVSAKSGVDYDDLFSEALSKLPTISKNYIAKIGGNFPSYLKTSLRGYLKNYIRDNSFAVKIPRRTLDIYMKTRKYSSHLIASLHTKWDEKDIREAHETIRKYRAYNVNELQSWTTAKDTLTSTNEFSESIQICKEAEINQELLLDAFVNDLPEVEMVTRYGKNFRDKVNEQAKKLKSVAISQGYAVYS